VAASNVARNKREKMEFLGVGPSELVFIIVVALIILGPKDMQKAGKTLGKWMRNITTSDGWNILQQTSRELRTLPNQLMRETNEDLNRIGQDINKDLNSISSAVSRQENSISNWMKSPEIPPQSQPVPSSLPKPAESSAKKDEPSTADSLSHESVQVKDA
jgi:Sec-independent protein translocase protein TatA